MKLNLGCGRDYRDGWWNSDVSGEVKADAYLDIQTDPLPHGDNSVDNVYISGVLEQILETKHLIFAMNECHRVLKPGHVMEVVVPNAKFAIAHQDPMDVRKFTPETFPYFQKGTRQFDLYGKVYGFKGWSEIHITENERHILVVTMKK